MDGGGGGEAGELVPVARVGREAAEAYARDRHARAQEELLPFRRLCGRANVAVSPQENPKRARIFSVALARF